jgi:glutamate synthase (NADPH/NADH) small chain
LLKNTDGLALSKKGYIEVNADTLETSIPGVFAGGDITTGAATVIAAMGAGKKAARQMAEFCKRKQERSGK